MAQFTPNAGRNRETTGGRRQSRDKTLAAVIHFYLEAARRGKNNFVTAPMGVTAADFALGNISNPENTLNREGDMHIAFQITQKASFVHRMREFYALNALRHDSYIH